MEGLGVLCCCGGFLFVFIVFGMMGSAWRRIRGDKRYAVGHRPLGWHKPSDFNRQGFGGGYDAGLGHGPSHGGGFGHKPSHGGGYGHKPSFGGGYAKGGGKGFAKGGGFKGGGAKSKW